MTTHVIHYWSRLDIMYNKRTNRQVHTHKLTHTNTQSSQFLVRLTAETKRVKIILLHAYSISIATGAERSVGGGPVYLSVSLWDTTQLHGLHNKPFPCIDSCVAEWTETIRLLIP